MVAEPPVGIGKTPNRSQVDLPTLWNNGLFIHLLEYSNNAHAEFRNHPIEIRAVCLNLNANNLSCW